MENSIKPEYEIYQEAKEQIKEIIMKMNGYSEEEVISKYIHDAHFHKGFEILVRLLMKTKSDL